MVRDDMARRTGWVLGGVLLILGCDQGKEPTGEAPKPREPIRKANPMVSTLERSKVTEAFNYLSTIKSAQQRYQAQYGTYADSTGKLDVVLPAPKYFSAPDAVTRRGGPKGMGKCSGKRVSAGSTGRLETSWQLTLKRSGGPARYGAYTVTYNERGYDPGQSSIESYPGIRPAKK